MRNYYHYTFLRRLYLDTLDEREKWMWFMYKKDCIHDYTEPCWGTVIIRVPIFLNMVTFLSYSYYYCPALVSCFDVPDYTPVNVVTGHIVSHIMSQFHGQTPVPFWSLSSSDSKTVTSGPTAKAQLVIKKLQWCLSAQPKAMDPRR